MTTPTSWSDHFLNARATPALDGGAALGMADADAGMGLSSMESELKRS